MGGEASGQRGTHEAGTGDAGQCFTARKRSKPLDGTPLGSWWQMHQPPWRTPLPKPLWLPGLMGTQGAVHVTPREPME